MRRTPGTTISWLTTPLFAVLVSLFAFTGTASAGKSVDWSQYIEKPSARTKVEPAADTPRATKRVAAPTKAKAPKAKAKRAKAAKAGKTKKRK
jgi:hypothetical protein